MNKADMQTKSATTLMTESLIFVQWLTGYAQAPQDFIHTITQQRKACAAQAKAEARAALPSKARRCARAGCIVTSEDAHCFKAAGG